LNELSNALAKIDARETKGLGDIVDRNRIQQQLDILKAEQKELKKYEASLNTVAQTREKVTKPKEGGARKSYFPTSSRLWMPRRKKYETSTRLLH
jgi:hypothetical protein